MPADGQGPLQQCVTMESGQEHCPRKSSVDSRSSTTRPLHVIPAQSREKGSGTAQSALSKRSMHATRNGFHDDLELTAASIPRASADISSGAHSGLPS